MSRRRQRHLRGIREASWQSGLIGVPNDGVRDLPDVSLFFRRSRTWGHVVTFTACPTPAAAARLARRAQRLELWRVGTSFATPIWAGIQALINQKTGERQGNPNFRLYQIADAEYGGAAA